MGNYFSESIETISAGKTKSEAIDTLILQIEKDDYIILEGNNKLCDCYGQFLVIEGYGTFKISVSPINNGFASMYTGDMNLKPPRKETKRIIYKGEIISPEFKFVAYLNFIHEGCVTSDDYEYFKELNTLLN